MKGDESSAVPWVVVHIRAKDVGKADRNIRNQGGEFYCPRAWVRSPKGKPSRSILLFPGYAFARHPERRWSFLKGTFGISGIVMGTGEQPGYIADVELAKIRAREDSNGLVRLTDNTLAAGQKVRVEQGPLSFDAIVEGMSGEDRVWVLMHILGQWSRAEVPARDIKG